MFFSEIFIFQSCLSISAKVEDPPVHVNLLSKVHVELHPSPAAIFPSSHTSGLILYPSPHIGLQVSFAVADSPVQLNLSSIVHVELHPSPFTIFPSSQFSSCDLLLFPQMSHTSGEAGLGSYHEYPDSTIQNEFHPSLFKTFPSSQASNELLLLSPQG